MVRTLVFDKDANELFKKILDDNESASGLLIGSINETKDYILHIIPTPIDDSEDEKNNNKHKNLYDENWIVNHALQVHDMLIGGIDILGLYCIDIPAVNARQILNGIFKSLNEFPYYKQMNFNTDRILFQVDSASKNVLMKTIDISNAKSIAQKCDMIVQDNFLNEFYTILTNYDMNSVFTMPNVHNNELLKKHFYSALSTEFMFEKKRFLYLIDNQLFNDDKNFSDLLIILKKKTENNNNNNNYKSLNESELVDSSINNSNLDDENKINLLSDENHLFTATLLENLSESTSPINDTNKVLTQNLDSIYHVTGGCTSVIYFHKSTSVKLIKQKIIYDIMRSIFARLRLLTDDLDAAKEIIGDAQLEDPNSVEESYQTPKRIYININENKNNKFLISDYVFPDEIQSDIIDRINDIFSYEIKNPVNQIISIEKFPPDMQENNQIDENCPTIDIDNNSNKNSINEKPNADQPSSLFNNPKVFISIIVAIFSFLISLWFINSKN